MNDDALKKGILDDCLLKYAVRVITVCRALPKSYIGIHIGKQMLRSGTSAGANYQEAVGSESRRDFVHKMQLSLKELRETLFWLRVINETKILTPERLASII